LGGLSANVYGGNVGKIVSIWVKELDTKAGNERTGLNAQIFLGRYGWDLDAK
jgi:hypothetical protein